MIEGKIQTIIHNHITVIISVTGQCNLSCKYCYRNTMHYTQKMCLSTRLLRELYTKLDSYSHIALVWHGGEPLMMPKEFFEETLTDAERILGSRLISNSIQSNGTLMDEGWLNLFDAHNVKIGFSFDGLANEITRGQSGKIEMFINLLEKTKHPVSFIHVLSRYNVDRLNEDYEIYRLRNWSIRFSVDYTDLESFDRCSMVLEGLYRRWINDKGCKARFITFEKINGKITTPDCSIAGCISRFISVSPDGRLWPCARMADSRYCFGTIFEINSIRDAFCSQGSINLLHDSNERIKNCKEKCAIFDRCHGGCNAVHMSFGSVSSVAGPYCKCMQSLIQFGGACRCIVCHILFFAVKEIRFLIYFMILIQTSPYGGNMKMNKK